MHHLWIERAFGDAAEVDRLLEFIVSGHQRAEERTAALGMIEAAGEVEQAAALRRRQHPPQRHRRRSQAARIVKLGSQPDVYLAVDVDDRAQRRLCALRESGTHLEDVSVTKFEGLLA